MTVGYGERVGYDDAVVEGEAMGERRGGGGGRRLRGGILILGNPSHHCRLERIGGGSDRWLSAAGPAMTVAVRSEIVPTNVVSCMMNVAKGRPPHK